MKKKNDVNVNVGVEVDKRAEKKLGRIDRALAMSRKKVSKSTKKQKQDTDQLTKSQRKEADAVTHAARALQRLAAQHGKNTEALRRYSREADKSERKTRRLTKALKGAGGAAIQGGKSGAGALAGATRFGPAGIGLAGVGAAGGAGIGYSMNLQRRMSRLQVQSNASPEEISDVKQRVFSIAKRKDVAIDPGQLFAAVEKVVNKNGDLGLAKGNLLTMAQAISATGSRGEDIGAMVADIRDKFGVNSSEDILKVMNMFVEQGKAGSFTLEHLASQMEVVTAAYSATERKGSGALQEMGALLQVIKSGTGSPEMAATTMRSIISNLRANHETLADEYGVDLFDQDAMDNGKEVMRSIPAVIGELLDAVGGRGTELSGIFGEEAIKGINALNSATGRKTIADLMRIDGTGTQLADDSGVIASDSLGKIEVLKTKALQKVDRASSGGAGRVGDAAEKTGVFLEKAGRFYDELFERFFSGDAGAINGGGSTQVTNNFSIVQSPGESGEQLTRRIVGRAEFANSNNYSLTDDD